VQDPVDGGGSEDLTLVRAAAAGDRSAMDAIVLAHQAAVLRLARGLARTEAAAEDVLQETFLAAFRHLGEYRGDGPLRGWLLAIAHRTAVRQGRRRAGEPKETEPLEALGEAAGHGAAPMWHPADPEDRAAQAERREALAAALDTLSPDDRTVLVLRDLEGLGGPEVARILAIGVPAMKTRLHRARLRLLAALRKGGLDAT